MDFSILLIIAILTSVTRPSSAECHVEDRTTTGCNYTVVCRGNPGRIPDIDCNAEPYAILVITESNKTELSSEDFSDTNFDKHVQVIRATGNLWKSFGPYVFRYFTKTIKIDLMDNEIEIIRSHTFRRAISLQYLNISHNKINKLMPLSFSTHFGKKNSIQLLDLSFNNLVEITREFYVLSNLRELHLQNNNITYIEDKAFQNVTKLVYLNLSNNNLKSLNSTLSNLTSLTNLDISNNHLIKLLNFEMRSLRALVSFNASHNDLVLLDPYCFAEASQLQLVDFSYNNITSVIENVMFNEKHHMKYIDFSNNNITDIQSRTFSHLLNLSYINLEYNRINYIKDSTYAGLRCITKLDLSRQNVQTIENYAFSNITSPLNLNLSINAIELIHNKSFAESAITVLDLSKNKIYDLSFMEDCLQNLTELYLNMNYIRDISINTFKNKLNLRKLDLSINSIFIAGVSYIPLVNLEYLDISWNGAQRITLSTNAFSKAKHIRYLNLSHININRIGKSAFGGIKYLWDLNLSHNGIKAIDPNNFQDIMLIHTLDISYNNLTDLTCILSNVEFLYLSNNQLTNVSKLFSTYSKIVYLDLSSNNITDLSNVGRDLLPYIMTLLLANNNIRNFNNPSINSLTTLTILNLRSNKIDHINLSYFKNLETVDLSNNYLRFLDSTRFCNKYLLSLDLSRNNITNIPLNTFKCMENLKSLNLSSNHLTALLEPAVLTGLNKTESLDLSRNNIKDINVDMFYLCQLNNLNLGFNNIKTLEINSLINILKMSLTNLTTLSLEGNPMSCKEIFRNIKSSNAKFDNHTNKITLIHRHNDTITIKCEVDVTDKNTEKPLYLSSTTDIFEISYENHFTKSDEIVTGDLMTTSFDEIVLAKSDETTTTVFSINKGASVKPESLESKEISNSQTSSSSRAITTTVIICCTVLIIILISGGVVYYIYIFRKRTIVINYDATKQGRNSISLQQYNHSEGSNDI